MPPSSAVDVDVLVIGAGPVGLSTALQLGRAGIKTLVVDRHAELAHHPKAVGIHARTMEIFRQWGIADRIRGVSLPLERCLGFAWLTRMNGIELGKIMLAEDAERIASYAAQCPELPCFAPQDYVEPILRKAALEYPSVEIRMSTEVTDVTQDADRVTVSFGDQTRAVRAGYVVAADGARSFVRGALGFGETASRPHGESVNVYFRADLDEVVAGRPYLLWWVVNRDIQGAFWPTTTDGRWIFNFERDPEKPDGYFDEALCTQLIRSGTGVADLQVEILSILRWKHEQAVADRWRIGRVLLVGDAAHRFPPHGGFGMNSGIQDAVNLGWKLASVVLGRADDALLDTYPAERKPIAQYNAEQTAINTARMAETGWLMSDTTTIDTIEEPTGELVRQAIADAIPKQREQFYSQGQQFGHIYSSAAVIDDETPQPRSTVSTYVPTTHPGARFPHLWVTDRVGETVSTIDLVGRDFVLFAGAQGQQWILAAKKAAAAHGVDIACYLIGVHPDLDLRVNPEDLEILEIDRDGAVLVRPDAHVGYRAKRSVPSADPVMDDVLTALLSRK
ncbi:FAD-dependent oxidoreductase [Nocardia araoensis]|uniref:FAD-dependent oxidoreductase n=1 Tax=Nocardia araoensis TaxID=228600 RepID=UPI0009FCEC37|nr:FAD-dependent oxidoreductase [Nocardia araoensis]